MTELHEAQITEQEMDLLNILRRDERPFELRIVYRGGRYLIELTDEDTKLDGRPAMVIGDQPGFDDAWTDMCFAELRQNPANTVRPRPTPRKPLLTIVGGTDSRPPPRT